jgi:DNA-binding response OmpR family regulator
MTVKRRIVMIEDEPDILEVVAYRLEREGFEVSTSRDGEEGLARIRREHPDLVILDLMLPGVDGTEICRLVKRDPQTRDIPIIMVTAKSEESDVVLGLGLGADDYVPKPFSPRELVARVQAVLRRAPVREADGGGKKRVTRGPLVIDTERHEVMLDGERVPFTATELRLLHVLAARPGRVYTRDELLSLAVGEEVVVGERNIDVHVRSIRQKLGGSRELIETVRGVGYRFHDPRE